jgi:hypothetical protein
LKRRSLVSAFSYTLHAKPIYGNSVTRTLTWVIFRRTVVFVPRVPFFVFSDWPTRFGHQSADRLFISPTGRPAAQKTVKRWVEDQLQRAGVVASAGSLRSAATSAAFRSGVDIDAILKSAGWKREETWRQHYLRPIYESNVLFFSYAPR